MTRAALFGKRTLSLFLALLMLASALPAALAEAPADDGYALAFENVRVPASSKDVDTSTESGKMLKEYMEWLETEGDPEMGSNTPVETWEADPDAENGWLEGHEDIELINMELPMELVDEAALAELGLSFDTLGVESLDELDQDKDGIVDALYGFDILKSAARAGLGGLMNGDPQKAMIDWGKKTILAYVFGDFSKPDPFAKLADMIERGFKEINAKLDAIKKQLDDILDKLKQIIQQQVVEAYRSDIRDIAKVRDKIKDIRDVTRISLTNAGIDPKLRQAALEKFHDWRIDGNVYLATSQLGNMLVTTKTKSGKDAFTIAYALADLAHYPWDHTQAVEEDTLRNYFLLVYMEQMAYCKLSLLWQIQKNKKNPGELQNLCSLYKLLFTGDKASSVESNASRVIKSLDAAPMYKEDKEKAVYRTFKKELFDFYYRRDTNFTKISEGGPARASLLHCYESSWCHHRATADTWTYFDEMKAFAKGKRVDIDDVVGVTFWKMMKLYKGNDLLEIARNYTGINVQANKPFVFPDMGSAYLKKNGNDLQAVVRLNQIEGREWKVEDTRWLFTYSGIMKNRLDGDSIDYTLFVNEFLDFQGIVRYRVKSGDKEIPPVPEVAAVPIKGEVVELREDGFLFKPDEDSLTAANESMKAQSDQYAAAQAALADPMSEDGSMILLPDSFTPNDDGLLRVQYLPYLDESLPENNTPSEVDYAEDGEVPVDEEDQNGPVTPPEDLPNVGDVVEVEAFNMGTFTEEQQANGFVNDDGGDFLFSTRLTVLENNFDSAMGEVTMLTADTLTLWQAEAAQPAEEAPEAVDAVSGATADPGKEVTYLLTPDTKLDAGVAEGAYVRVTWKAGTDQPADAADEPQTLVSVALEEEPVVTQTAQGEISMLGAATLSVMTDEGEKTFTTDQAQVEGELAEGAKVSVLYGDQGGELIAVMITVEEAPVGPVEVLTVDGTATEVSEDALTIDGNDGNTYTFDLSDATVEGDLEEDSPVTVVYYAEGETLMAIHILADKPPVGPVEILTMEGAVTAVNDEAAEVTADDGTAYAFELNGARIAGELTEGCQAEVSYYLLGDKLTAVTVTVTESPVEPEDVEAVQE